MRIFALILIIPLIVALIYREPISTVLIFLCVILLTLTLGFLLCAIDVGDAKMHAREGLITTGLTWIIMSLVGCLPPVISGQIPSFLDALFETVSGFTTTGMSILENPIETLSHSMLFLRSFTHWIGGMGVLVFVLAVLPASNPTTIHLMKQESPGPKVSKLVSKVKNSAMILYAIYVALTLIMTGMLALGGVGLFDSIIITFGTAGTGGFALYPDSIAHYSTYAQMVTAVFMLLFGVNFNVFYLLLIGKAKEAFKSEELRLYAIIVVVAIALVTLNSINSVVGFWEALRTSFFHVASIITTTGYTISDIQEYLPLARCVLTALMVSGACSGSTCGGVKITRSMIAFKAAKSKSKSITSPREVSFVKMDGKRVDESVIGQTLSFFTMYIMFAALTTLVIAFSGKAFEESFSVALSAISNIGAQFNVTPICDYTWYCKLVIILDMLLGRLEIFPILMLFSPKTWRRV